MVKDKKGCKVWRRGVGSNEARVRQGEKREEIRWSDSDMKFCATGGCHGQ
jgi:hypothetical protein